MTDFSISLPSGQVLLGKGPVVVVGPNGSGKTRESRKITCPGGAHIEFVNALRSTRISPQIPAMSQLQARQNHDGHRNQARSSPWEITSDFDFMVAQILAEDGDAARAYRARSKAGESVEDIELTPLEAIEHLWGEVFPGRSLEWKDWAPVVANERNEVLTYSANQMSDGERAALYLAAKVMLAPAGCVLVVDEPETHFHSLLAIALWDALEAQRPDMRFVYVTHDLNFAMSRQDATFLLANGVGGLDVVSLQEDLPTELKKSILGAASFSYYASRVAFCEGEAHSLDTKLLTAWFKGRDTVLSAVGSCDAVRACVDALASTRLIDNLDAVGVMDRDYRPDKYYAGLGDAHVILPVHEIEGLICLPSVYESLAEHLGRDAPSVLDLVSPLLDEALMLRVTHDRWKAAMLGGLEDKVTAKPPKPFTEDILRDHVAQSLAHQDLAAEASSAFETVLADVRADAASGDIGRILKTFPSKQLAGAVASQLGQSVGQCFELMSRALLASDDGPLAPLGERLEVALSRLGLPSRSAELRATADEGA